MAISKQDRERFHSEFGRQGARARAAKLSPERRREIARASAKARWAKAKQAEAKGNGQ